MQGGCDVFCVGNSVADVLARPVDHLAPSGTSQPLDDVLLAAGGNSFNTAVALARLGVRVRVATAVGDDNFGHFLREQLRAEGIEDSGMITLAGGKTSTSIVLVEASGERRFLHLRGVGRLLSGEHIDWRQVEGARVFHCASVFALPRFDETALAPALERAREMGCLTSVNICWDVHGRWMKVLQPALAYTDFIFPNRAEGQQLTGESEPAGIAARLRELGAKTVVVKLGAAGCYIESAEGSFTAPGFPVQPVDTTGAGDCFAAGFLAAICRGRSLAEAARYANAVGAMVTLNLGAADSAPRSEEVEGFLRRDSTPKGTS